MLKLKLVCISFVISLSSCWAQGKNADSLKVVLQTAVKPVEKFNILNELIFGEVESAGHSVDSTYCMQLLQIAQQLKNDSLLAIAYNHLGSYFSFNKGDFATGLEFYFKGIPLAERVKDKRRISSLYFDIAVVYSTLQNYEEAAKNNNKGLANLPNPSSPLYNFMLSQYQSNMIDYFLATQQADSALYFVSLYDESVKPIFGPIYGYTSNNFKAAAYAIKGDSAIAEKYFRACIVLNDTIQATDTKFDFYKYYIPFLLSANRFAEARTQSRHLLELGQRTKNQSLKIEGAKYLRQAFDKLNLVDSAYYYSRMEAGLNEQIFSQTNKNKIQSFAFSEQIRLLDEKNKSDAYQSKIRQYSLLSGLGIILIIAFILYRNNRQKQKANKVLEITLGNLKSTQSQLIQSEKMASLGELTAGIAHEIQNPLNFVNNFSEVNIELIDEMNRELDDDEIDEAKAISSDLKENLGKISHHGKRASDIVKSMLEHSRLGEGKKEPTDINKLADEYLRLAYHGYRAKDKNFNAEFKLDLDPGLPMVNVVPQDIGRVLLNLINNAFYVVRDVEKPLVTVTTKAFPLEEGEYKGVIITVSDNGPGIPEQVREKIFQPFFTTKPTGQGTGLGLSLSYDIVTKGHGGIIEVDTKEGIGTTFQIKLPYTINSKPEK